MYLRKDGVGRVNIINTNTKLYKKLKVNNYVGKKKSQSLCDPSPKGREIPLCCINEHHEKIMMKTGNHHLLR